MCNNSEYCKNCGQHLLFKQKFCHECGQKSDTHRINFHFLIHEIQHGIFHIDGGILYTVKELFNRPGHSIREYLQGKRQNHFKPVLFIMILGSLVALVNYWIYGEKKRDLDSELVKVSATDSDLQRFQQRFDLHNFLNYFKIVNEWIANHFGFAILILIPFFAVAFFLAFRKYKLNYPEWLVISTFISGQCLVVYLLFLLVGKFTGVSHGLYFITVFLLIYRDGVSYQYKKASLHLSFSENWNTKGMILSGWETLHKLRLAMRHRDSRYELKDHIELDEGFFETIDQTKSAVESGSEEKKGNQGRGSNRQAKILVTAEMSESSEEVNDKKTTKVRRLDGRFRKIGRDFPLITK